MASPKKELRSLRRHAEAQGWTITETGAGHLQWTPPFGGDFVMTSSTPNDQNIINTIKSDLEAAGLVMAPSAAKQIEKAVRDGTYRNGIVIEAKRVVSTDNPGRHPDTLPIDAVHDPDQVPDEKVLRGIEKRLPELWMAIEHSSIRKQIAVRMVREWLPAYYPEGLPSQCDCGREYEDPFGLAMHIFKNNPTHQPVPQPPDQEKRSKNMERNMADPPARERLNCPECSEWFWISQPEALDAHTRAEHGKGRCPYCGELYKIAQGGLTKHMRACEHGPDKVAARESARRNAMEEVYDEPKVRPAVTEFRLPEDPGRVPMADSPVRGSDWNPDPCPGQCGNPVGESSTSHCPDCQKMIDQMEQEERTTMVANVIDDAEPEEVAPPPRDTGQSERKGATITPLRIDASDDDLFDLLEVVLDGPVMVTRESLSAINDWMAATRRLIELKESK